MRGFFIFILSMATGCGAENGIRVVTTAKTNAETASIYTTDVFTRNGETNLVRRTRTKGGVVQIWSHQFYHHGVPVGDYIAMKDSSGLTTEASIPYSVTIEFGPSKDVRSVVFGTNGVVVDAFMATNGLFYPADETLIRKANHIGRDLSTLLSPSHVTNTSPGDFGREVEQFIEKHKGK